MSWLVIFLVKSSLVLLIAWIVSLSPLLSAACKHLVLLFALACLPLLLLLPTYPAPTIEIQVPDLVADWVIVQSQAQVAPAPSAMTSSTQWQLDDALIALYAVIGFCFVVYWLGQILRLQIWVRSLTVLQPGIGCEIATLAGLRLRLMQRRASPFAWGFGRGTIVLPANWQHWSRTKRGLVLAHEAAHLRRFDVVTSLFATLLCCLYWFHPLVWLVRRQLLLQAEFACDDVVLSTGAPPLRYAQELINISRSCRPQAAPAMASSSNLNKRVCALLQEGTRRNPMSKRQLSAVLISMVMIVLPLGSITAGSTPTMSQGVLHKLETSQAAIDAKDYKAARDVLETLAGTDGLNGNEVGQAYNMLGYVAFLQEDYEQAIQHYQAVIEQRESIPAGLNLTTLYTLAQLNFVVERYQTALDYMAQWMDEAQEPGPIPHIFMAQTLYQMDEYEDALARLQHGLAVAEQKNVEVKSNWLKLRDFLQAQIAGESLTPGSSVNDEFMQRPNNADGDYMPIVKVAAVYPQQAKKQGVEGYVLLEFTVQKSGRVVDPVVVSSEPPGVFDHAALSAVRKFKYKPRVEGGEPVEVAQVRNRIDFSLR